jgi:hypothetical protein
MRFSLGRFLLSAILVIAVQVSFLGTALAQTKIVRSGTTGVSAMSPKGSANITIHTTIFDRSCACACPTARVLDELNIKETSVIPALEISVAGKPIVVPTSVYDGLFDPREASLRFEKGIFILRIDGADAAYSYFVRVYFDGDGVKRLVTYSSLVPDKPTGDTHYFHVALK